MIFRDLARWIKERQGEKGLIPDERKAELRELSGWIGSSVDAGETARIVFICTHNSRRPHLAQVWAQTAAHVYGVAGVETYSGGTEATAFNPRAVAALTRAGFHIQSRTDEENPVSSVRFADDAPAMRCFSKVYDQPPNPRDEFCAVMTCSSADEGCPVVFGAFKRIAIRYDDPKDFDGTEQEAEKYDERCRQIAREMLYAISEVRPF